MKRLKIKHIALLLLFIVGLIVGSNFVKWQGADPTAVIEGSEIASFSVAEAPKDSERLHTINVRLDDTLYYVGRDHEASSSTPPAGKTMDVNELITRYEQHIQISSDRDYSAVIRLAELYELQRRWDEAALIYEDLLEVKDDPWIQERLDLIQTREPRHDEKPMLTGSVEFGERPMAGVTVYLKETDASSWSMPPRQEKYPMVITDDQGVFRFYDVPAGKYDIGVGAAVKDLNGHTYSLATPDAIMLQDGKHVEDMTVQFNPNMKIREPIGRSDISGDTVSLSWDPYPGATYYKLRFIEVNTEVSGSNSFTLPDRYEGSTVMLDVLELREHIFEERGFQWYGDEVKKEWVSPTYILGYAYPGSQYLWSVEAYDQENRKISSSKPLDIYMEKELPMLVFGDESELHPGDRKILEGAYDEAKEVYEQDLDNPHALRTLANLYVFGTVGGGDYNYEKALSYLQKIENPSLAELRLMKIAYDEMIMIHEAEEVAAKIKEITVRAGRQ